MANETKPSDTDKALAEIDKRIIALGERVVKLESVKHVDLSDKVDALATAVAKIESAPATHSDDAISRDDLRPLFDAVNALHLQVMGVPAGLHQSLAD